MDLLDRHTALVPRGGRAIFEAMGAGEDAVWTAAVNRWALAGGLPPIRLAPGEASGFLRIGFGSFCLASAAGLTGNAEHGVDVLTGASPVRRAYQAAWQDWHARAGPEGARLPFLPMRSPYTVPPVMRVAEDDIRAVMAGDAGTASGEAEDPPDEPPAIG